MVRGFKETSCEELSKELGKKHKEETNVLAISFESSLQMCEPLPSKGKS